MTQPFIRKEPTIRLPYAASIPADVFDRCKEIADRENTTPNTVIIEAVRAWLGER